MHSAESRCYKNGIVAGHIWRKGSHCCENGRSARTENASSSALSMNSWCHLRLFAECESVVKEELFMTRNEGCWVFLLHYTVTVKTMSHVKWNRMIAGDEIEMTLVIVFSHFRANDWDFINTMLRSIPQAVKLHANIFQRKDGLHLLWVSGQEMRLNHLLAWNTAH